MTREEAIRILAVDVAVTAIQEQERQESPKPLTLDELRQIPLGEWVWIKVLVESKSKFVGAKHKVSAYYKRQQVGTENGAMKDTFWCGYPGLTYGFEYAKYGKTWIAYRHKPKEE